MSKKTAELSMLFSSSAEFLQRGLARRGLRLKTRSNSMTFHNGSTEKFLQRLGALPEQYIHTSILLLSSQGIVQAKDTLMRWLGAPTSRVPSRRPARHALSTIQIDKTILGCRLTDQIPAVDHVGHCFYPVGDQTGQTISYSSLALR